MGSEFERQLKASDQAGIDSRTKLTDSVRAELSGAKIAQSGAKSESAEKASELPKTQTSGLIKDLEIAGIAVAATGLLVASIKYKPLRSLSESVLKLGGEDSAERLAQLIPKYPELGLDGLVTKITNNLNQGCLTRETFSHLVGSVAPADQGLASSIAKLSLPNASDFTLMHSLRDMGKQLEASGIDLHDIHELTSANPASPGQTTAYLFRKANGIKLGIHNLGAVDAPISGVTASTKPIFLFDHVSDLSTSQLEHLQKATESGRSVFLMDANNFQGGINFTDFAKGTAESKLQTLVDQAKTLGRDTPGATHDALASRVLNEKTDQDAAAVGATVIRPSAVSEDTLFRQLVNRDKVEDYLARFQNPAHKRFAAETLADIDYDSFSGIAKKTQKLSEVISADAKASNMDPSKDIQYLVGIDNWPNMGASSGGFVSSIYREMNGLPPSQFVDFDRMYYRSLGGPAPRRVYVLDDMSHSGEQIREVAFDLRREHGVGGLSFSTISALKSSTVMKYNVETGTPKGLRFLTSELKDPIAESSRATIKALKAESGFFGSSSDELLQAKARRDVWLQMTKGTEGKKALVANQLNPYVVSDRTNPITADFAKQVLNMRQWGYSEIE
jgi:hypothetical protein